MRKYFEKESAPHGVSELSLLMIAFVILKLCGVINWSWWWVLAPCWIPTILLALAIISLKIIQIFKKKGKTKHEDV